MTAGDLVARADRALMYGRRAAPPRRGAHGGRPAADVRARAAAAAASAAARPAAGAPGWTPAAGRRARAAARPRPPARASPTASRAPGRPRRPSTTVVAATVDGAARRVRLRRAAACCGRTRTAGCRRRPSSCSVPRSARTSEPWGALTLARDAEPFGDDDQRLLETIAGARRRGRRGAAPRGARADARRGERRGSTARGVARRAAGRRLGMETRRGDLAWRRSCASAERRLAVALTAPTPLAAERWDGAVRRLVGEAIPSARASGERRSVRRAAAPATAESLRPAVVEAVRATARNVEPGLVAVPPGGPRVPVPREDEDDRPRPRAARAATTEMPVPARHDVLGTPLRPPFPDGLEQIVVGHGLLLGRRARVLAARRRLHHRGRLRGRLHAEPDLRGGVLRLHGPHGGRARRVRPRAASAATRSCARSGRATTRRRAMRQGNDVGTQYRSAIYTCRRRPARRGRGVARGLPGGAGRRRQAAGSPRRSSRPGRSTTPSPTTSSTSPRTRTATAASAARASPAPSGSACARRAEHFGRGARARCGAPPASAISVARRRARVSSRFALMTHHIAARR